MTPARDLVIVGGGLVGLELAEFLLARGRQVTVLEPTDKPGGFSFSNTTEDDT